MINHNGKQLPIIWSAKSKFSVAYLQYGCGNDHDFVAELSLILSDPIKSYKETAYKDATKQTISMILSMMKDEFIVNSDPCEHLEPSSSPILKVYGLPKFHKIIVCLHHLLNMNNSSYHSVAKWSAETL